MSDAPQVEPLRLTLEEARRRHSDAWERWQATGLIDRWAAVEPARCDATGLVHVDGHWSGAGLPGSVLAAVAEAIEARGWEWSLWSDGALAEATVTIPGEERRKFEKSGGGEPAVGLLMAYLEALQAEGES